MIVSLLLCFAASKEEVIEKPTFRRIILDNEDSVIISGMNKTVFIAVQSYAFVGKLSLTITESKKVYEIELKECDRYSFTDANITAKLTDGSNTVSFSLYVVNKEDADMCYHDYTIHSRELTSATIAMIPEHSYACCILFDFTEPPMISELNSESSYIISEEGHIPLSMSMSLSKMFIFVGRDNTGTVKLTTNLTHCDWNERDSVFTYCRNGNCKAHDMPTQNPLTSERKVASWIWICSYGIPAALIAFLTILMCIPKKGSREYVTVRYMTSFTQNSVSYYT